MRSCAEVLRLLGSSAHIGDEEKDMAAFLVFNLREIFRTIDESAQAWDEKNYWKKAEALRDSWRWSRQAAMDLERLIRQGRWTDVPELLIALIPRFSDITVTSVTRDADWWCGAYRALMKERAA